MQRPEPDTIAEALDQSTAAVLECLAEGGFFGEAPAVFTPHAYHGFAARVAAGFSLPQTSVTTAAARLLFGLAETVRPRHVLVLGSYFGNSLIWLAGPHLCGCASRLERALGCDIDAEAVEGARANLRSFDEPRIEFRSEDARDVLAGLRDRVDLLLIDVDDPVSRKRLYRDLAIAALPRLAPGALVLAHDRFEARFAQDFDAYLKIVRDPRHFSLSVGIPIDDAGFELSRVAASHEGVAPEGGQRP